MSKIIVNINDKDGTFLVRKVKIRGVAQNIKVENPIELIEILLVGKNDKGEEILCYFDFEDFKPIFKCTLFELQYSLRTWLNSLNIADNSWTRVDILIPNERG